MVGKRPYNVELLSNLFQATSHALSKWRTLSAFLMHPNRSQRTPLVPSDSMISPQALALAAALNNFLYHFVQSDQAAQHQQTDHLHAVILECTKFGYVILSQPNDWQFIYHAGTANSGPRSLVLSPGLDKSGDKEGNSYSSSRHVVAPVVVQV